MKYNAVIGIRTHKWTSEEERLYNVLLQYFSPNSIFVIVDEILKAPVNTPKFINKISLDHNFLEYQNILFTHPAKKGLGWLCGDYFYYAMESSIDAEYYWLIEPDVGFTFDNISDFFFSFEKVKDDALVQSYQKSPEKWMWKKSAELINSQAYKSFFPLTRLSKKAIIECKKARVNLTERLCNKEFSINLYPNDEALVATVVGNNPDLKINNLKQYFPYGFKYFTYMQSISVMPNAKDILPKNQILHPIRSVSDAAKFVSDKIINLLSSNREFYLDVNKIILDFSQENEFFELFQKNLSDNLEKVIKSNSKMTSLKLFLDKELDNYPLLTGSSIWIWQDSVLVLDFNFLGCVFTLEFEFNDGVIYCNIFTRKGEIDIKHLLGEKLDVYTIKGEKVVLSIREANSEFDEKSFIINALCHFNSLFCDY